MTINEILKMRESYLEETALALQRQIESAPAGILKCYKNNGRWKWYARDEKKINGKYHSTYISQKNRPLAEQLAQKAVHKYQLKSINAELRGIHAFFFHLSRSKKPDALFHSLTTNQGFQDLVTPPHQLSEQLQLWADSDYNRSKYKPEALIVQAANGIMVRSKSEANISLMLLQAGIPFHYEEIYDSKSMQMIPDFTIRHPLTGEVYFWEHLGMIDDPAYVLHQAQKISSYLEEGFYPGERLILTHEDKNHPLSFVKIAQTIQQYFSISDKELLSLSAGSNWADFLQKKVTAS